jgi:PadR family transcriptional regulator PadR
MKRSNPDFLNGIPELLVLHLLAQRPMYGYELVQAIRASTGGKLSFGEGCIYPLLHKLEAESVLTSERATVANRSRVVYHLTTKGKRKFSEGLDTWKQVVAAVAKVIEGGANGTPAMG